MSFFRHYGKTPYKFSFIFMVHGVDHLPRAHVQPGEPLVLSLSRGSKKRVVTRVAVVADDDAVRWDQPLALTATLYKAKPETSSFDAKVFRVKLKSQRSGWSVLGDLDLATLVAGDEDAAAAAPFEATKSVLLHEHNVAVRLTVRSVQGEVPPELPAPAPAAQADHEPEPKPKPQPKPRRKSKPKVDPQVEPSPSPPESPLSPYRQATSTLYRLQAESMESLPDAADGRDSPVSLVSVVSPSTSLASLPSAQITVDEVHSSYGDASSVSASKPSSTSSTLPLTPKHRKEPSIASFSNILASSILQPHSPLEPAQRRRHSLPRTLAVSPRASVKRHTWDGNGRPRSATITAASPSSPPAVTRRRSSLLSPKRTGSMAEAQLHVSQLLGATIQSNEESFWHGIPISACTIVRCIRHWGNEPWMWKAVVEALHDSVSGVYRLADTLVLYCLVRNGDDADEAVVEQLRVVCTRFIRSFVRAWQSEIQIGSDLHVSGALPVFGAALEKLSASRVMPTVRQQIMGCLFSKVNAVLANAFLTRPELRDVENVVQMQITLSELGQWAFDAGGNELRQEMADRMKSAEEVGRVVIAGKGDDEVCERLSAAQVARLLGEASSAREDATVRVDDGGQVDVSKVKIADVPLDQVPVPADLPAWPWLSPNAQ